MTTDAAQGDIVVAAERQAAARALLTEPLLIGWARPEEFALVRTHADWLVQRFEVLLGYRLTVDAHFARLAKHTCAFDAAPRSWETAGSAPRGYAYLALTLAALQDAPEVVEVGALFTAVRTAAQEAGLPIGADDRLGERRPFAAALRRLQDWGVLVPEPEQAADGPRADGVVQSRARLRVHTDLLAHVAARLPHTEADLAEFLRRDPRRPPDPEGVAVEVRRRIVEQAVVYRDTLTEEQARWLAGNQSRCLADLCRFLGCEAEIHAEGVALVAPAESHGSVFPVGASDRAAAGVLAALVEECAPSHPGSSVTVGKAALRQALARLPDAWEARRALARLSEFSLLSKEGENGEWRLGAAAARYRFPAGAAEQ